MTQVYVTYMQICQNMFKQIKTHQIYDLTKEYNINMVITIKYNILYSISIYKT